MAHINLTETGRFRLKKHLAWRMLPDSVRETVTAHDNWQSLDRTERMFMEVLVSDLVHRINYNDKD